MNFSSRSPREHWPGTLKAAPGKVWERCLTSALQPQRGILSNGTVPALFPACCHSSGGWNRILDHRGSLWGATCCRNGDKARNRVRCPRSALKVCGTFSHIKTPVTLLARLISSESEGFGWYGDPAPVQATGQPIVTSPRRAHSLL